MTQQYYRITRAMPFPLAMGGTAYRIELYDFSPHGWVIRADFRGGQLYLTHPYKTEAAMVAAATQKGFRPFGPVALPLLARLVREGAAEIVPAPEDDPINWRGESRLLYAPDVDFER